MPASKLRKALGAVKDQTSLSLAKVTNAANLEVVILKATTHDEIPIEDRFVNEIVGLVSSNKLYAAACAQSIGKRIGKTRNWVVALKSLMIILRIFQDGDPYFPREVLHAMKRGSRILNLSGFRDDSSSSPWEYTAFVRLMALYLDERLDCFLTGKLQRRITFKNQSPFKNHHHKMFNDTVGIKDMKPAMLLDKITYWQRLLDRAIGTRPTGEAKKNRLVQISLYAVVQETFDLYRDISDGLAVILDSFFKFPYKSCLSAFQACVKSCKQFDELGDFYSFCLSIRVGRSSEYPKVQKISEELMETLQEFLRDQATTNTNINVSGYNHNLHSKSSSSSSQYSPLSKHLLVSALGESPGIHYERYGTPERYFETESEHGSSHCTSLEDLMIATDAGTLTPRRFEIDYGDDDQVEKQSENNNDDDTSSSYESCSNHSYPIDQAAGSSLDLVSLDEVQNEGEKEKRANNNSSQDCWELVLAETTSTTTEREKFDPPNSVPHHHYNPFLELDDATVSPCITTTDQRQTSLIDMFDGEELGLQAMGLKPTFTAQGSSFETDLTSIFGDLNLNTTSFAMTTSFSSQELAENNNMALVPAFQEKNNLPPEMNNSASLFQSQGSFKISSTSPFEGYNSYQMSATQTLNSHDSSSLTSINASTFTSQGSFKTDSASSSTTSQGYELYQTSIAPTFNSQGSFKISSTYQTSTRPTFNSQSSFKFGSSTSTSQSHDSYQTSAAPTIASQSSFKLSSTSPYGTEPTFNSHSSFKSNSSASSFHDHDSYQTSTTPPLNSQNSSKISAESTSQSHESYHSSIAPTFYGHSSHQTSLESTFQGHNSYQASIEQSFQRYTSYQASMEPTFYAHINSNQVSIEPAFQANNSFQTSNRPVFHGHTSSQSNTESTFLGYNSYLTSTKPPFHGNNPCQIRKEPALLTHNIYQTSTTPSPTFRGQNSVWPMVEATPTIVAKNPNNEALVQSTFWEQNFQNTMAEPTFRAEISNGPLLEAPKEDDPFGSSWPSSLTRNEDDAINKSSMQKLSLEQQKQIWLEQQKRIIEKHLN
ncbi:uncharacterized protein LOC129317486 [Prosopis cineraria]|uniref:uncharacterized protein LOC129317486 n=1 Tax=Prosopis cineraria TaxID=364024 RepID=UPI00240ECD0D|nr:uncharacterized protein LOC129317486 [Prosopis cineraria]